MDSDGADGKGTGVPDQPPCRCGHSHESHIHYRTGTDCGHAGCGCLEYRRLIYTRGEFRARIAEAEAKLSDAVDTIAQLRRDLIRANARRNASDRALTNFIALAPFCTPRRWPLKRPLATRMPRQRSA